MPSTAYELLIGKRVLHPIMDNRGVLLVPDGTLLNRDHAEKLELFKIDIFDIKVEAMNDSSVLRAKAEAGALVQKTEARLQNIDHYVHANGTVPVAELEEQVLPIIAEASRKRNLFQLFTDLKAMADFRYKQCIGVVVMSSMLGKWLHLDEKELSLLTTAASLYDIGSVKLPSYLLNKPDRFEPGEMKIMKEHAKFGYELLKESDVDPRVALVALQHHEREDGSGYPNGLKGEEIDRLSKIIALADIYVAMTSERPYRPAFAFYEVIQEIHRQIVQGRFDSAIGLTFLNQLMSAQIGSDVVLSDGRRGKILLVNQNYPTSPFISLEGEYLDLSQINSLKIKEIVG